VVVTRGLNTGDRVVTTGFTQLADKRQVTIAPAQAAEGAPGNAPPAAPDGAKTGNGEQKAGDQNQNKGGKRRRSEAAPSATP
jgi:hypothetical protein